MARREAGEECDIDLLILADEKGRKADILRAVIDVTVPIEVATDTVITPLVRKKSEFDRMLADGFSFAEAVAREGVVLFEGVG